MELNIILTVVVVLVIIYGIYMANIHNKQKNRLSFKESMDLAELPVITFINNGTKLNFLLDTGSNNSYINESVMQNLKYELLPIKESYIGVDGIKNESTSCMMEVEYKDKKFNTKFSVANLDTAFDVVKKESGVQIHGVLGSLFFHEYKYILNFKDLTAYIG